MLCRGENWVENCVRSILIGLLIRLEANIHDRWDKVGRTVSTEYALRITQRCFLLIPDLSRKPGTACIKFKSIPQNQIDGTCKRKRYRLGTFGAALDQSLLFGRKLLILWHLFSSEGFSTLKTGSSSVDTGERSTVHNVGEVDDSYYR